MIVLLALALASTPADPPGMHGPGAVAFVTPAPDWTKGPRSPRNASYEIDVRLDATAKTLDASLVLTWTNIADAPTDELRFHLYYNAWRNDRSSWLSGPRSAAEARDVPDDGWAWSDVSAIAVVAADGARIHDLAPAAEYIAPDDGNRDDRTVLRVPLPGPVAPGETIRVAIDWTAKIPRTFARTGFRGDYVFVAQWFPKIGVLERGGVWNCHQFIQTEFFADFGVYDVTIAVPEGWPVGASGREIETRPIEGGLAEHRFLAEDVHDFAWTTAPDTIVHEDRFEFPGLPSVDLRLLLRPDHADQAARYFAGTKAALQHYGRWWGPYPYDTLTIVDPAWGSRTGGMEYPTLFTGGSDWLSPMASQSPEGVTVHEAGHQFWYGIVANNEFEHAWLDEGFNTYSTSRTMAEAFGPQGHVERYLDDFLPVVLPGLSHVRRTDGADAHVGMRSAFKRDALGRASWTTGPDGYRVNAYDKGALVLQTLEHHLGWNTFQRVMSTYFRTVAFSHPRPEHFVQIAEFVAGTELSWFFDQVLQDTVVFDYAVDRVVSRPAGVRGWVEGEDGVLALSSGRDRHDGYDHSVYVRRWGEGTFPVWIAVDFADGTRKAHYWDGEDRWTRLSWRHGARIERVRVDPDHVLVLDTDFSNNSWLAASKADLAATKWSSKWMIFVQHTLEVLAFFS